MTNPISALSDLAFWLGWDKPIPASQWGDVTVKQVRNEFKAMELPWNDLVEQEVGGIIRGHGRRNFLFAFEWMDLYRQRRNIELAPEGNDLSDKKNRSRTEASMSTGTDTAPPTGTSFSSSVKSKHVACRKEQDYFLQTQEWQRCARAIYSAADHRCSICQTRGNKLEIHHEEPLFTAYSPRFGNNFARWLLSIVCPTCHRGLHEGEIKLVGRSCRGLESVRRPRWFNTYEGTTEDESGTDCTCQFCREEIATRFPLLVRIDQNNEARPSSRAGG